MRINKIKKMMTEGKPVINGWLQVPSTASAETMSQQGWDSLTIDMQHGLVDYTNALPMLQTISASDVTPLARVNWNEPGQIMKILDAGSYGIICPMVSNKQQAENFVQACMYPPNGYRSYGPVRGLIYGGPDYAKHADTELLKFAMRPEGTKAYDQILRILDHAKKNNIFAGIHNGSPEYAMKMVDKGFNFVTISSDQRIMGLGAKNIIEKIKGTKTQEVSKAY
jgi:4-hydroxy-2-oxoheptanedioate aldolase